MVVLTADVFQLFIKNFKLQQAILYTPEYEHCCLSHRTAVQYASLYADIRRTKTTTVGQGIPVALFYSGVTSKHAVFLLNVDAHTPYETGTALTD